jgi:HlyD family secretion protein
VREELLNDLPMGKEIDVMIPALGDTIVAARVYYVRDMGDYAVWRATKATGEWDSRTFKIKARPIAVLPNLRPGMSVIYQPQ